MKLKRGQLLVIIVAIILLPIFYFHTYWLQKGLEHPTYELFRDIVITLSYFSLAVWLGLKVYKSLKINWTQLLISNILLIVSILHFLSILKGRGIV